MPELKDFFQSLKSILFRDGRYREDAYLFVLSSLFKTLDGLSKPRHLTGAELLDGMRRSALEQYGPMSETVFLHWGVKNSLDFGRIVFNMVQEGILSKTDSDALSDFEDPGFIQRLFDGQTEYRVNEIGSEKWQMKS